MLPVERIVLQSQQMCYRLRRSRLFLFIYTQGQENPFKDKT
jgi:hypothetical protein